MDNPHITPHRILAALYWFIVLLFCVLEPWGNVDMRDFSYMGVQKFWEYNAYISFVLIAMIVLGIVLWKNNAGIKTLIWMAVINTMFIVMVLFDLLHFFPDPAQPLPFLVSLIEIITAAIAFGMLLYSPKMFKEIR